MEGRSVVAWRLKEARVRAGLSQKQLGIKAGIDEFSASPRINQYERGKHSPDVLTLERLARVLKVPMPYFFARDDDLAQVILRFGTLTGPERKRLTKSLRQEKRKQALPAGEASRGAT